jgi:hypothetical protein
MSHKTVVIVVAAVLAATAMQSTAIAADHICDPVTDRGWSVVPDRQVVSREDGTPYQAGASGNWFVDRVTTVLPFCNYYNSIGIYSMRSYSLDPEVTEERIAVCTRTADGGSAAVPPYTGPCPPKPGLVTR